MSEMEDFLKAPQEGPAEDKAEPKTESKPEVKQEEPEAKPNIDPAIWEKRFKDSQRFIQETREQNKLLQEEAEARREQIEQLKSVLKKHNKDLYPDEDPIEFKDPEPKTSPEEDAWKTKVAAAEELIRTVYSDYDEKVSAEDSNFRKAVEENSSLMARVKAATNPALEAYRIAEEYAFTRSYGKTPEEIKAKLREEVLRELKNEQPPSLRDVGASPAPKVDRSSLHDIFKK